MASVGKSIIKIHQQLFVLLFLTNTQANAQTPGKHTVLAEAEVTISTLIQRSQDITLFSFFRIKRIQSAATSELCNGTQ